MASANLYKKIGEAESAKNQDGGYKRTIFFAPVSTFTSVKHPTASPTALGDKYKVTTAHTFPTDEGFIGLLCKKHSVTVKGAPVGDEGHEKTEWTFEAIVLGDSPEIQEQLLEQQGTDSIWLMKDQDCLNAADYVQFGDDCLAPSIKVEFTGNTTKEGLKEYKITGTVKGKKFWYSSTVTEKPVD